MGAITTTVLSEGSPMDPMYQIVSVDIWREINRIPQAELRLFDGSVAKREFAISDSGFFDPGAKVEIKLRYEGEEDKTVFKGVVVRHSVSSSAHSSVLVVTLKDAAVKLTAARKSAVYVQKTDDAIVKQIIGDAGLEAGTLDATKPEHPEMVQYYCTPWDFILSRADAQGALVLVDDGKISMTKMTTPGEAKHQFDYGIMPIYEIDFEADAGSQYEAVESVAWDAKELKPTEATKAASVTATPGDLDGEKLGGAIGNGTLSLCHPVPADPDELQAWADAKMARSRLSLCRGRIAIPGFADIKPLDGMEILGVGKRFNGTTTVTGLRHRIDSSGWRTDVQFGLPPEGFSPREGIIDAPAAGLLPAVSGLQIGIVADAKDDPNKELRVQVILPAVDPKDGIVWARLASPDAGKDRGYFFRPEPEDEVVVGFLNGDPRHAVILGGLYGSKNTPAAAMGEPTDKNEKKGIVTKKGTTIGFMDGDKASVFIETTNKNKLLLDDDGETISLTDQHGNSITMNKDGIELKSAKKFTVDASDAVEIKGSKVDIK